jgi:stearoyl-CoA desaturase (delta-9 desaturase)
LQSSTCGTVRPSLPRARLQAVRDYVARNVNKGPFVALHLLCLAAFFVPVTWTALGLCAGFYFLRMFFITAGYHRYFAHRSYKTSRWFQFILAWFGCTCMQKGPLWWAAKHRDHHKYSDTDDDPHSPVRHGLFWSHIGWVLFESHIAPKRDAVKDFAKYPELRWLERLHWLPGFLMLGLCYLIAGWSGVVWGFVISTVLLYHGVFLVNSLCHILGRRRFQTADASRNNALVALLTFGEGWHNNHHHYQSSANQGFRWWEIDISYYLLCLLRICQLVWDLRKPPPNKLVPTA